MKLTIECPDCNKTYNIPKEKIPSQGAKVKCGCGHKFFVSQSPIKINGNFTVDTMSGYEFEDLISLLMVKMDFDVETTKKSADGGIDLIVHNNEPLFQGSYIVQCKRWNSSVGEPLIRDLYGVVTSENANKGILITNSTFTNNAIKFAQNKPIELIDGEKLYKLLTKYGLIDNDYSLNNNDSLSNTYEDDKDIELLKELSIIQGILREDPNNLNLRIKLAYKQIDNVWYGWLSKTSIRKMIRDAEDNLNYLVNSNLPHNKKVANFIKHMSFHQLGYLKTVQGEISDGIRYYLKSNEINSFTQMPLRDPNYYSNIWLNDFYIQNLFNIMTLSNYIGANKFATKILTKYKNRISKFINNFLSSHQFLTGGSYFKFMENDWMNRAIYIMNYWEDNYDLDEIIIEDQESSIYDEYNYDSISLKDFHNMLEVTNIKDLLSISNEERNRQKKIIDAIT